jgi:hypothetical protein
MEVTVNEDDRDKLNKSDLIIALYNQAMEAEV